PAPPVPEPPPPPRPGRARRTGRVLRAVAARARRRWPAVRLVVFALVGAVVAVVLFGRVPAKVGPFETTLALRPSLDGSTVVHLSPLGTIELDTHDWPVRLDLRVEEIGLADAERIAEDPSALDRLGDDAPDDVRAALTGLVVRCVLLALAGGVVGGLAARTDWRSAAGGVGVALLLVVAVGGGTVATFDAGAVAEPRYTGLLTRAPQAVGDIEAVLDRFGEYREQLSDLVDNMAALYLAGAELPTFEPGGDDLVRVLHVSDIHLNPQAFDMIERLVDQFGIEVVADTGDLTDWGTTPETRLVSRVGDLDVPYVYVRGNHDSRRIQEAVAEQPNAVVLDGDAAEVAGLRFWGIGDPRYTPDKSQRVEGTEAERAEAFAPVVADRLAEDEPPPVDVVMVHDQRMAADLGGEVPLVLAGHTHEPDVGVIEPPDEDEDEPEDGSEEGTTAADEPGGEGEERTLLLVEGSTGGAGLRGLQGEEPEPLTATVLYFDREEGRLVAYDRITVAWLEDAGATIERHIVDEDDPGGPGDEPGGDEAAPAVTSRGGGGRGARRR
ncbi:MAG: metallophosphoesterase, partial [Acidimicrobiia bacterium]